MAIKTMGKALSEAGDEWSVECPECGKGMEFSGFFDPEERLFFGYVSIFGDYNDEWGYFPLDELESVRVSPFGLGIERNMFFEPQPISKVCPGAYQLMKKIAYLPVGREDCEG